MFSRHPAFLGISVILASLLHSTPQAASSDAMEMARLIRKGSLVGIESLLDSKPALVNTPVPLVMNAPKAGSIEPLLLAFFQGVEETPRLLIKRGADLKAQYESRSPQHWAAQLGWVGVLNDLRARDVNFDAVDSSGRTPLYCAAMSGSVDGVSALLAMGAKVNSRDALGRTTLHAAVIGREEKTAKLIISNATYPIALAEDNYGITPLHMAAATSQARLLEFMLEDLQQKRARGVVFDVNKQSRSGRTPLHFAKLTGLEPSVQLLLRLHANTSVVDNLGRTPDDLTKTKVRQVAESRPQPPISEEMARKLGRSPKINFEILSRTSKPLIKMERILSPTQQAIFVMWPDGECVNIDESEIERRTFVSLEEVSGFKKELQETGIFDFDPRPYNSTILVDLNADNKFKRIRLEEPNSFHNSAQLIDILEGLYVTSMLKQSLVAFLGQIRE